MKVALVYDRVVKWGGAERVLLALHEIWPEAPLYTAVFDPKRASWAKVFRVMPSLANRWPGAPRRHEFFVWLMPLSFENFSFDGYDLVISITSEAAKGIITKPGTLHVCYCLTPTRYLWSGYSDYFPSRGGRWLAWPLVGYLRVWDRIAAQRPDFYLTTCQNVKQRIRQYYGREATVIYPPVDCQKWPMADGKPQTAEYFLVVSRLVGYKRVDLAVKTFNQLGWPLKVVGVGRQQDKLKRLARPNIEFLGHLTDRQLLGYYQKCRAVVFPGEEDFGLVPLEAQSCGRPVIVYRAGGAKETVIEGKTGLFFSKQTIASLTKAVQRFEKMKFDPAACRQNALRFRKTKFVKQFKKIIEEQWKNFPS